MPPGVLLVVDTVNTALPAVLLLIVTLDGLKAQVGAGLPPVIALQDNCTLPVKPLAGVTVMVEVDELPAVMEAGLSAVAVSV